MHHPQPHLPRLPRLLWPPPPPGAYAGMDRFAAREKLWADMDTAGLVIKKEAYTTRWGGACSSLVQRLPLWLRSLH